MNAVLNELDALRDAAREATRLRRHAASLRETADHPPTPRHGPEWQAGIREAAADYDAQADALEPKVSRLRRAVAILEKALNNDTGE